MKITIGLEKEDAQQLFANAFPHLRLEFMSGTTGLHRASHLCEISDNMTVQEVETDISRAFGLPVQIMRKTGKVWIETAHTKHWTLSHQNEHGREISAATNISKGT